jgi:cobyrinic acid a,c-diamide synthase
LPDGLQGLYFGGGYPELFAAELSANTEARQSVRDFILRQGPVYAECGGLMYLTECIVGEGGREFAMAGILPTKATMHRRLAALGYVEVEGVNGNELLPPGQSIRGQQFRYSEVGAVSANIKRQSRVKSAGGDEPFLEGYRVANCLASYVHLHFLSNAGFAARWMDICRRAPVRT